MNRHITADSSEGIVKGCIVPTVGMQGCSDHICMYACGYLRKSKQKYIFIKLLGKASLITESATRTEFLLHCCDFTI